jgi:hypothetical protein
VPEAGEPPPAPLPSGRKSARGKGAKGG